MKKHYIYIALTLFLFTVSGITVFAQPTEPPLIPIDGGISFLLAAGAAYGAKKIYDLSRKGK